MKDDTPHEGALKVYRESGGNGHGPCVCRRAAARGERGAGAARAETRVTEDWCTVPADKLLLNAAVTARTRENTYKYDQTKAPPRRTASRAGLCVSVCPPGAGLPPPHPHIPAVTPLTSPTCRELSSTARTQASSISSTGTGLGSPVSRLSPDSTRIARGPAPHTDGHTPAGTALRPQHTNHQHAIHNTRSHSQSRCMPAPWPALCVRHTRKFACPTAGRASPPHTAQHTRRAHAAGARTSVDELPRAALARLACVLRVCNHGSAHSRLSSRAHEPAVQRLQRPASLFHCRLAKEAWGKLSLHCAHAFVACSSDADGIGEAATRWAGAV